MRLVIAVPLDPLRRLKAGVTGVLSVRPRVLRVSVLDRDLRILPTGPAFRYDAAARFSVRKLNAGSSGGSGAPKNSRRCIRGTSGE
jgi:hypothetical protein